MEPVARHVGAAAELSGGRIGPNAITRIAEAVEAFESAGTAGRLFARAGLAHHVDVPPTAMVDESDVVALHRELRGALGDRRARSVSWIAGRRTADYLLAHRIPPAAQRVLKAAPPAMASRMLLAAIGKHAWTFAGTGDFSYISGHPTVLRIENCPICRGASAAGPLCDYYAATFERLFAVLVSANASVVETACAAAGAKACTFEIIWR